MPPLPLALANQFKLIQVLRDFFRSKGFTDVLTPPMLQGPGMEAHLHPFKVSSPLRHSGECYYLHTSPEFAMKELLSYGHGDIFTICYCFRDGEESSIHRKQFLMLEWYRVGGHYHEIADDFEELYAHCAESFTGKTFKETFTRTTVKDLFLRFEHFDITDYPRALEFREFLEKRYPHLIPFPGFHQKQALTWDELYHLFFFNVIEPKIKKHLPYLILDQYPEQLVSLAATSTTTSRATDRFEVFVNALELGNGCREARDEREHRIRLAREGKEKERIYGYQLPEPTELYETLKRGLPPCSGMAVGLERLLLALGQKEAFWSKKFKKSDHS